MNNTFGVAGTIPKHRHDLIQKKFKHIGVKVLLPADRDEVPNFIVTGANANIPEKWAGAPEMPKEWLQYMMKVKLANLVWVDPKQWMEENMQEQREEGGDEGEEEEGGDSEEVARGKKRRSAIAEAEEAERKRAQAAKDQAAKDQAAKDQPAKDQAAKDQAAKDQAAKDQAAKDQAAKDQAAKDQPAKDQPAKDIAEVHTQDPYKPGQDKGTELPGPVKQESTEPDLSSIPTDSSDSSKSPSPGPDSSSNSSERSTPASSRGLSPEAEDAEKQAQNAIIKARDARAELERAQRAATEAVDNARTLGAAVTYIPDLQPDDPCAFVIPGYMRKEKTPAMGRIAYNTDKGYFLVLETSVYGRHRMYMFSGLQYFSNRDAFLKKYKGKTLVANVETGEEDEDDKVWKISIEGVAVLRIKGKNSKIFRVLITWRDNNNPDSELPELSNLTGFKRRFGKDATQRLAAEQRLSNMPMDWVVPPQSTDNDDGKAAYFRRYRAEFEGLRLLEGI